MLLILFLLGILNVRRPQSCLRWYMYCQLICSSGVGYSIWHCYGTKWPFMCWCAVKKYSLTLSTLLSVIPLSIFAFRYFDIWQLSHNVITFRVFLMLDKISRLDEASRVSRVKRKREKTMFIHYLSTALLACCSCETSYWVSPTSCTPHTAVSSAHALVNQ